MPTSSGIIPTASVMRHFLSFFPSDRRARMETRMATVDDPNEKISYLRSCVIGALVTACADAFAANEDAILAGRFDGSLLHHIPQLEKSAYEACNDLSWERIYRSSDVVDIELAGNRIITFLMERLVDAVRNPGLNYSRLLLSQVPQQYDVDAPDLYGKIQAVVDHVSGMTDVYALDLFRKLNGMSLKINN